MAKGGRSINSKAGQLSSGRRRPYNTGGIPKVQLVPVIVPGNGRRPPSRSAIASALKMASSGARDTRKSRFNLVGVSNKMRDFGRYYAPLGGRGGTQNIAVNQPQRARGAISAAMKGRVQSRGGARGGRQTRSQSRRNDGRPSKGRNSRGNRKGLSTDALDTELDAYMGEDARKQRLDTELDAYFSQPSGEGPTKPADTEAGEIMQ